MIEKGETEEGYIQLSHQKAQRLRAWDEIEKAYNEKTSDQGSRDRSHQGRPDRGHSSAPARSCPVRRWTCVRCAISMGMKGQEIRCPHHQAEQEARQHRGFAQADSGRGQYAEKRGKTLEHLRRRRDSHRQR